MTFYTIIDTNVIVSSMLTKNKYSPTYIILNEVFNGNLIPFYSSETFQEYEDVLYRPKFDIDKNQIKTILETIAILGCKINTTNRNIYLIDPKDIPFYALLLDIEKFNSYLITGNKRHFPDKINIVSPNEFLNVINNRSWFIIKIRFVW